MNFWTNLKIIIGCIAFGFSIAGIIMGAIAAIWNVDLSLNLVWLFFGISGLSSMWLILIRLPHEKGKITISRYLRK